MGGQVMLMERRFVGLVLAAAVWTFAARATAQEGGPEDGLRRPDRLTAGISDQLLGQLAPDGKTLYFVSTRNTTRELFAQNIDGSRSRRLFDESADVTWPRIAPDGKAILYVSFRDGVAGQLCVRDLPDGDHRRCLSGAVPALEAEWIDGSRIVAVVRPSIEGGLRVIEVAVGSRLSTRPMFDRNLSTPAVSPDGRWLVYVPVERSATRVGPAFAAQAGKRLEAVRLDHPDAPAALDIDLPGRTGQPVFSRDGRYVYFVQFLSDSNHDGVIDADDHGVLFRAPIGFASGPRLGVSEQLTDTAWNCQYPAPAATQLVATCTRARNLDIYTLPLDGEIPAAWSFERVNQELEIVSTTVDQQLLYHHRLERTTSVTGRLLTMANLVRLHLGLDDFRAAEFYSNHIAQLDDPKTAGLSRPLLTLVEHRRALRQRELGHLENGFEDDARARLDRLREEPGDSRAAITLLHVVRSELADTTGDKTRARAELEQAVVDDKTPPSVVRFYYERADALYRELDDRAALVAVCRHLSTMAFDLDQRLDYARSAVRAMTRGLAFDVADAELVRERTTAPDASELAFAIDLARALLAIRDDHPPNAVRDAIVALYQAQTRSDRRRVVVLDAARRAQQMGADTVTEVIAERYLADTTPGTLERRRAEHIYQRAISDRAYRLAAAGHTSEARADFDAVASKTGSLESVVASIDLRVRSGNKPEAVQANYDAHAKSYTPEALAFVKAYLIALELPYLKGTAFDEHAANARTALRGSEGAGLRDKSMVPALRGAILHQQFLHTGDPALAMRANVHDLVALDLAGSSVRVRAMLLDQLGILHTSVGNYQMALSYLKRRDELPYVDDAASLAARMAEARSQLHAGHDGDAARVADESLAMTERAPALAEYRVLALDRAALYNLSAGRFDRALALYDTLIPLLGAPSPRDDAASRRNRFVLRTARAAAEIGAGKPARALDDLAAIEPALRDPSMRDALNWPHASADHTTASYGAITAGLRANAYGALGQLDAQGRALADRRARFAERLTSTNHDEFLRALALVETRLAGNAAARGDAKAASGWASTALAHADELRARTAGPIASSQVDAIWLAAELVVFLHAQPSFDLRQRLGGARSEIAAGHDRQLHRLAGWLDVYDVLTARP